MTINSRGRSSFPPPGHAPGYHQWGGPKHGSLPYYVHTIVCTDHHFLLIVESRKRNPPTTERALITKRTRSIRLSFKIRHFSVPGWWVRGHLFARRSCVNEEDRLRLTFMTLRCGRPNQ
ncbi:uncharacterized protein PV06_08671 [Exophiala oligosperma]|uniref:Uncharacterized protein n=1 Tax=Exophiala oligosperma TaxID=215243 RepID=A0A0D2BMY0_9EURO|nr:uncharacterized protein PV06_08671 [Exophiala oligosperma]KIW38837.1 hypothetical protein PV06_08671 [Exophiala oligosperma]